ncbi:DNA polymerase [Cognatiluteimonas weifangensis]|uniref:DNA polymerase n=1 Tax=Cognatiluteimonas weifangensis TaxID=2303539 RepID=A0A372DQY3_9GAMM|nr:DNA polymerase [Luteimonas weifangensis]RFP61953.1 DNA polymerase [Luteimonas weifangensis]
MTLRCLFVDFDSYFASVEQYDRPQLRGQPVAVVPVAADSTCCLAASYEAKRHGVKTGTGVREARERCPGIRFVLARPARYIALHQQLMDAIQDCIPHGKPSSIDEVPCRLLGRERERANAEAIARGIKQQLRERGFSPAINCSIGIAPNRFLAKTASDMDKPDGLTVIELADLPQRLHALELRDFCGIGPSMEARLHAAGIHTSAQLCAATRAHLRAAWGSVEGERYWLQLRGHDLPERESRRGSIGHSHVLAPQLRNFEGMRAVLFKLLAKAAMRLRGEGYLAQGLAIRIRFVGRDRGFERDLQFAPLDDTPTLLDLLGQQLESLQRGIAAGRWQPARHPPLSVAVTLVGLQPGGCVTRELLRDDGRRQGVSSVLDRINRRYGNNTVYFGAMQEALAHGAAPMRIPFSTIPDIAREDDPPPRRKPIRDRSEHDAHALWLQRERQFKILAEDTHRRAPTRREPHRAAGADSRAIRHRDAAARNPAPPRELF